MSAKLGGRPAQGRAPVSFSKGRQQEELGAALPEHHPAETRIIRRKGGNSTMPKRAASALGGVDGGEPDCNGGAEKIAPPPGSLAAQALHDPELASFMQSGLITEDDLLSKSARKAKARKGAKFRDPTEYWDTLGKWQAVETGDDVLLGSMEGGFAGLEVLEDPVLIDESMFGACLHMHACTAHDCMSNCMKAFFIPCMYLATYAAASDENASATLLVAAEAHTHRTPDCHS